jgi:hypothetical protein
MASQTNSFLIGYGKSSTRAQYLVTQETEIRMSKEKKNTKTTHTYVYI